MRWDVDDWYFVEMHTAIEQPPSDRRCSHKLDASNYPESLGVASRSRDIRQNIS